MPCFADTHRRPVPLWIETEKEWIVGYGGTGREWKERRKESLWLGYNINQLKYFLKCNSYLLLRKTFIFMYWRKKKPWTMWASELSLGLYCLRVLKYQARKPTTLRIICWEKHMEIFPRRKGNVTNSPRNCSFLYVLLYINNSFTRLTLEVFYPKPLWYPCQCLILQIID